MPSRTCANLDFGRTGEAWGSDGIRILAQGKGSSEALNSLHGRAHLPERSQVQGALLRSYSVAARSSHRRVETEGPCRGALESFSARERAWRRIVQSGIRSVVRDYGPIAFRSGGVQLLGAGHGQHGSAGALWIA